MPQGKRIDQESSIVAVASKLFGFPLRRTNHSSRTLKKEMESF